MKSIIILGDGMADEPIEALGGKTPMQYADTPYMDKLAEMGVTGRMKTVADGFHPGSEVANMAVLGYDLPTVYEGRGVLEAASIGYDLKPSEMAMRCNLICVEGDILKNHSSGHITTEEADELIRFLNEKLGSDRIHFYTGVSYRHLLVVKGGDKRLDCNSAHDVPLHPFRPLTDQTGSTRSTGDRRSTEQPDPAIAGDTERPPRQPPAHRCRERPGKQHMALVAGISSGYANHAGNVWLQAGFRHLGRRSDTGHRRLCRPGSNRRGRCHRTLRHELRRKSACRPRSAENKRFRLSSCRSQRRSRTRRRCRSENPDHRKPGQTSHRYPLRGIAEMG